MALDKPGDNGSAIVVTWEKMPWENAELKYIVLMADQEEGPYFPQAEIVATASLKSDMPGIFGFGQENANFHAVEISGVRSPTADNANETKVAALATGKEYFFKLRVKDGNVEQEFAAIAHAQALGDWFDSGKLNSFITMLIIVFLVLFFINKARRNPNLFIRRIAGLEAIDEALGRATEMGRPALFCHGQADVDNVSCIAALNILGKIAGKAAEYDAQIKVANSLPLVYQVSQETVKEAYIKAGRPDAYKEESVVFTAADQFSYAAAVDGIMIREKPATNFFFGYFYAEALLLTEAGASTGAIQIAGTDAYTQIPFFIATCDYTLMGEELYAASAYLAREPKLLGSLKGQDMAKALIILVIIIGCLLTTFGFNSFAQLFWIN